MRTTIRLEDSLLRRAKAQAAASGRSLNDFISDAVQAALAARPIRGGAVELPTFRGHGLQPGIDLDDSAGLLDVMESARRGGYPSAASKAARRSKVAERPKRRRP